MLNRGGGKGLNTSKLATDSRNSWSSKPEYAMSTGIAGDAPWGLGAKPAACQSSNPQGFIASTQNPANDS